MRFIKSHALLLCILAVGIFFRLYHFNQNPPSMNWDEVSIGFNAYSILKTGKDEFGNTMPLYFRSLDDYKMPVYVYMTAASIKVFGYNDFAVRLPALLFGILTIYLMYVLAMELTRKKDIALLAAFVTAITPWNIMFSRMASEANVAMSLTILAMILFLYGIRKDSDCYLCRSLCLASLLTPI
jgi:4-amino-4-deoxy-L-arabinose transferase-like glycosyltransferase